MAQDWQERFRAKQIRAAVVAGARPERGLVVAPDGADVQLHAWRVETGELTVLTDRPGGVPDGWIDPAGTYVYYLRDEDGSELGHVVRVPFEPDRAGRAPAGPAPAGRAPAGRAARAKPAGFEDLTPNLADYTLRGIGFDGAAARLAINPVNGDGFALYTVDLLPQLGEVRLLYRDRWETWGALLSTTGGLAACWSTARAGGIRHYTLLVYDAGTGEPVCELDDGRDASVVGVAFSPIAGEEWILASTTRSGYLRPVIWDPRSGERRDIALTDVDGDVQPLDWSPDGDRLLLCELAGAQRLHVYDLAADRRITLDSPAGRYYDSIGGGARFDVNGDIVGLRQVTTAPPDVVMLDGGTGKHRDTLLRSADAPPGRPWRSVSFQSSDATPVQGWLAAPEDGPGPYPTILELHGGPHLAFTESYDPQVQSWLEHGYAWLGVNHRGSTGFGARFAEQIWGDLGHWEIEDAVAARSWLVDEGIAAPDGVLLHGWSYGGYLTLLGLGRRPELWAGGIAVAALGDLTAAHEQMSEALRAALSGWMRGTPAERPEAYAASSPITYAEAVTAPLLVIQGRHDTRTPPGQLLGYERRMRELGKDIEVDWYDSGHRSIGPDLRVRLQQRMLDFAGRLSAAVNAP